MSDVDCWQGKQQRLWLGDAPPAAAERQRRRRERPNAAELERLNAELAAAHAAQAVLAAELDKMTRSRDHWEKQVKGLKAKLKQAEKDNWQLQNRPSYAPFSADSLTVEIWRRLVQLVHPDKHGGSEAAHEVTAWLNQHKPRSAMPL